MKINCYLQYIINFKTICFCLVPTVIYMKTEGSTSISFLVWFWGIEITFETK